MNSSRNSPLNECAPPGGLAETLAVVADFYDRCRFGVRGTQGYRKSTDLRKMTACILDLCARGVVGPERTLFLDLGCADGRVNVLLSYVVERSLGIEIDPEILAEYGPHRHALQAVLEREGLLQLPENVTVFPGSSLDGSVYERMRQETGHGFERIDLFYTYITLHDVFAEKIRREAKDGAFYLVYGFCRVLPRYEGLDVVLRDVGDQGIAVLYRKGM